ncbi:MAG TPA: NEW3 domain-containing protein [Candidatus Limnocylindria bacterium]|nr:NEW3 domain-containing protein [Candidatus Limnocylindria bacterium]
MAAQEGLDVTTLYPAVTVDPGSTARFPLSITTDLPQRVDLEVTQAPQGWTARVRGGGSTVEAVYTGGEEPPEATLEVEVPEGAAPGSQQVVLEARAGLLSHQLTVDLSVQAVEAGAVSLTGQFPNLRGPSDATFQFDLELSNDTNQETTFSLETQAARGWRAEARPTGEEQAATAVVEAGGSSRVQVTVTPPINAAAGVYPVVVRAVGGPEPAEAQLAVEITGTPSLAMTTADQRLNARVTVGSSSTVDLVVTNDGTAPLTDVRLAATPPRGWEVTFNPETIAQLAPNESVTVVATIQAAADAIAGDYAVNVRLSSEDVSDPPELELRTTVETSALGGALGLGVLGAVLVGLLVIFRRYGRR